MAASGGHLLVFKAMRSIRSALDKTTRIVRDRVVQSVRAAEIQAQTQPAYARLTPRTPINRAAAIKQSQSRWYSTKQALNNSIRYFSSESGAATKPSRASYPQSRTATAVSRLTSRAPFATTLRPNLTGGTLCRSAGGYGTGAGRVGAVRYFSHTPAAPAQVVSNVSQAIRAFWLSGQKARFDGINPRTGEKRFRSVSDLQDEARHMMDMSSVNAPGSFIDFKVTPTITAIGPLSTIPRKATTSACDYGSENTLNNPVLMSNLSIDFARALKDLAAIMNDLKHLAVLGDLPISLENSTTLRVRFPGCDADTVERLCRELNIRRGLVGQDETFNEKTGVEMALLFPFAPSRAPSEISDMPVRPIKRMKKSKRDDVYWQDMLSAESTKTISPSPHRSLSSCLGQDIGEMIEVHQNPGLSSPSGYSSLHSSDAEGDYGQYDGTGVFFDPQSPRDVHSQHRSAGGGLSESSHEDFEGIEGIYRFIEECDRARR